MRFLYHMVFAACVSCATTRPLTHASFDSLASEQKLAVMKKSVLPQMTRLFDKHYGEASDMRCESCHGKDAEAVGWKMPNSLPALHPEHMPDRNEDMARFMEKEVTPKLSALLGQPATCFTCHPRHIAR